MLTNPPSDPWPAASTLRLTPRLLTAFTASLQAKNITLSFLSGAWSPKLTNLLAPQGQDQTDLILASETIYSPLSLRAFTRTLIDVLRNKDRDGGGRKALVAAKMVYFGVGGGVREFLRLLREEDRGGVVGEEAVVFEGGEGEGGVKRVVMELRRTCG
jgi:protein-histidine N-methyltransferase